MRLGGIVLCGGQSRRMGQPKAWLPFGDELMLQRVVRLLRTVVSPIVVVAAPDQNVPPLPDDIILVRDEEKGKGPLQGLSTGLDHLKEEVDAVYLSSCDVPFLQPAYVQLLLALLGEHDICVPHVDGFHHPLAAIYRMSVRHTVTELLSEDRLRPFFLFEKVPTRVVDAEELRHVDPEMQTFRNLNTPEDYDKAIVDWQKRNDLTT